MTENEKLRNLLAEAHDRLRKARYLTPVTMAAQIGDFLSRMDAALAEPVDLSGGAHICAWQHRAAEDVVAFQKVSRERDEARAALEKVTRERDWYLSELEECKP